MNAVQTALFLLFIQMGTEVHYVSHSKWDRYNSITNMYEEKKLSETLEIFILTPFLGVPILNIIINKYVIETGLHIISMTVI